MATRALRIFVVRANLRNYMRVREKGWRIVWGGEGRFGITPTK